MTPAIHFSPLSAKPTDDSVESIPAGAKNSPGLRTAQSSQEMLSQQSADRQSRCLPVVFAYGALNIVSAVLIVVANKLVLHTYSFAFPIALTWLHTLATCLGMQALAAAGVFTVKRLPWHKTAPNAVAYAGYIVFNNISIQLNTISFYQISKICITPAVVAIEWLAYGKTISQRKAAAVCLLLVGIAITTVSDSQISSNSAGLIVAALAVISSALCQVWAGTKQKELEADGNQLLHQIIPTVAVLLAVMVPALEPLGLQDPVPGTILGYRATPGAVAWMALSCCLGMVVTLSSYLFIGVTSPLTFNVVGHLKTVLIVAAGMLLFDDHITPKKAAGLACAVGGIAWYSAAPDALQACAPPRSSGDEEAQNGRTGKEAMLAQISKQQE